MRILVTGGTGFFGKHLQQVFIKYPEHTVMYPSSSQLELLDRKFTLDWGRDYFINTDIIIHAAAACGGIQANKNNPAVFLRDNTQMALNIYEAAREVGVDKVYSLGSVCAYPKYCPVPFKEDDIWNGAAEETNFPYGQAKRTLMLLGQTYREQYGIKGAHFIPVNMYGECFSSDTELATPIGWKNVADFKKGDLIYTLNPDTHKTEIERVTATQQKETNTFVNFKGSVIDLRVTPEHKIYYKTNKTYLKKRAEWFIPRAGRTNGMIKFATSKGLINAADTKFNDKISLAAYIDKDHEIRDGKVRDYKHSHSHWIPIEYDAQDFYAFLGWYISEGSRNCEDHSQLSISQSSSANQIYCDEIAALLKRMGLPVQKDDQRFYFSSRLWKNFIEAKIGTNSLTKKIPEEYLHANAELLECLFDGLMKGDGDKDGSRYTTNSDILKDQIVLLAMLTQRNLGKVYFEKDSNCWRIPFRSKRKNSIKYRDISVEHLQNNETAFCVTTERNHIVYAKRNNKCCWVGQCDHFDLVNSHVIPALINKFTKAVKDNLPIVECWGTGEATREFLYAGDAAEAVVKAVLLGLDTPLPINLGTGKDISIKDLAYIIGGLTGFTGQIVFTGQVSDGQPKRMLDVSRAKELLNFTAKTDLIDGLQKTIFWYRNNKEQDE